MLPVYKAIALQQIIEVGARTKPWVVSVQTNDSQTTYIVKLFTRDQITFNNSVTAEVICNKLAKHFFLRTPQAALIEFSEDFQMNLKPKYQEILNHRDERIKFGTVQIESDFMFTPGLPKTTFKKACSAGLDTLFAFDNLIRNSDRGSKPNVLFSNGDTWLIDHEKAFDDLGNCNNELAEFSSWKERFFKYHITYTYLKNGRKTSKLEYFREFITMLNELRISELTSFYKQLEHYNYDTNQQVINNHLKHFQQNYVTFENLLRHLIA